jgi:hypothetical protein
LKYLPRKIAGRITGRQIRKYLIVSHPNRPFNAYPAIPKKLADRK